ncbi:MAG TPA: ParA family protein, partial [Spongiibacteraceae bacterium]|nr:ParA family protein [Spongiibacteraceae bacterium]
MHIWTVANQKGGVGKTTTTVALAGLLSERGARVLVVDLDPHGSLTSYFGYNPEEVKTSAFDLFADAVPAAQDDVKRLLVPAGDTGIQLLAASPALATVERRSLQGTGVRVSKALALLWDDFDYALLDTPPVLSALMVNALAACERLLIPVQTEFLALKGLERMLRTLEMLARSTQKPLPYLIIPTMFDRRTHAAVSSLHTLRYQYEGRIWPGMIPIDTRFRDASRAGKLPSQFDPDGRGVAAYRSLLKILLVPPVAPAEMVKT